MHLDRVHRLSSAIETRHIMLNCHIRFYTFIHISTFLSKGKIWTILNKTELAYSAIFSRKSHELFPSLNVSSFSFLPLNNGWDKNKKKNCHFGEAPGSTNNPSGWSILKCSRLYPNPCKAILSTDRIQNEASFQGVKRFASFAKANVLLMLNSLITSSRKEWAD